MMHIDIASGSSHFAALLFNKCRISKKHDRISKQNASTDRAKDDGSLRRINEEKQHADIAC